MAKEKIHSIEKEIKRRDGKLYETLTNNDDQGNLVRTTFLISALIVAILQTIVDKCPWMTSLDLASKRVFIGAFPAGMRATVTDDIT